VLVNRHTQPVIRLGLLTAVSGALALSLTPPASAGAPDHFTVARDEHSTFSIDCGDFVAEGEGTFSDRFTVYFDREGNVTRFTEFVSAPADVWTNPETGATITIRGHFTQHHERIPGTDDFNRTVTGFRYIVNQPGSGAVIQEVGRVTYDNLDETSWSFLAGQHDWVDQALIEPGICDLLS
jgi:hypothetical protein